MVVVQPGCRLHPTLLSSGGSPWGGHLSHSAAVSNLRLPAVLRRLLTAVSLYAGCAHEACESVSGGGQEEHLGMGLAGTRVCL